MCEYVNTHNRYPPLHSSTFSLDTGCSGFYKQTRKLLFKRLKTKYHNGKVYLPEKRGWDKSKREQTEQMEQKTDKSKIKVEKNTDIWELKKLWYKWKEFHPS